MAKAQAMIGGIGDDGITDEEREDKIRRQPHIDPVTDASFAFLLRRLDEARAEIERRRLLANVDHETIARYAEELRKARAEIARLTSPPSASAVELWQDLLEKDDRTSPEEYPDMALITQEEFETVYKMADREGERRGRAKMRETPAVEAETETYSQRRDKVLDAAKALGLFVALLISCCIGFNLGIAHVKTTTRVVKYDFHNRGAVFDPYFGECFFAEAIVAYCASDAPTDGEVK